MARQLSWLERSVHTRKVEGSTPPLATIKIIARTCNSSSFFNRKLHSWYDKDDKYIDVVNDMYEDNVLDDDDIEELDLSKEKDDFER